MSEKESKAFSTEITAATDNMKSLNQQLKAFEESLESRSWFLSLERQLQQFRRRESVAKNRFGSSGDSGDGGDGTDKDGVIDAISFLATGASVGELLMNVSTAKYALAGAGAAALVFAMHHIVSDAIETIERENAVFQDALQSSLSTAFQGLTDDLEIGILLAGDAFKEKFLKITEGEQGARKAMGTGFLIAQEPYIPAAEAFYADNQTTLDSAYQAIGSYKGYQQAEQDRFVREARSILMGNEPQGILSPAGATAVQAFQAEFKRELATAERMKENSMRARSDGGRRAYLEKQAKSSLKLQTLLERADALGKTEYSVSDVARLENQRQNDLLLTTQSDLLPYKNEIIQTQRYSDNYADITKVQNKITDLQSQIVQAQEEQSKLEGEHWEHFEIEAVWDEHIRMLERDILEYQERLRMYTDGIDEKFWKKDKQDMTPGGHAYGLPYVPYDGYRARLHEGERVLTAQEARGYGKSGANMGGVTVTVNGLTVREEADIDRIASQLYTKIRQAQMIS